jgi:hypothetical protein
MEKKIHPADSSFNPWLPSDPVVVSSPYGPPAAFRFFVDDA